METIELTRGPNDGETLEVASCTVGDDSGTINARITGKNAALMTEGATLAFRNGRSVVRDMHMRLEIDRWGKISNEEDNDAAQIESVNEDAENNKSATEYEVKEVRVPTGGRRGGRGGRGRGRGRGRRRRNGGGRGGRRGRDERDGSGAGNGEGENKVEAGQGAQEGGEEA
jgi:hypothetical protein